MAEPTAVSFCLLLLGTNASKSSSNFNLFPAWEDKCTVGVHPPDIQMQSHSISSKLTKLSLSELSFPIIAEVILRRPLTSATPELNLISNPNDWASLTRSPSEFSLVSTIKDLILFLLNSIAALYAESLFVKIIGFLPTRVP